MTLVGIAAWAALLLGGPVDTAGLSQGPASASCQASTALARLPGLSEASGLAVSRATPGRLWSHNDSGAPQLVAIDASGRVAGNVTVSGARVEDWEALAAGPCPSGSCLYIGDIGDNEAKRGSITVYRIPEPTALGGSVKAEAFQASYPDGAQDAESLLVAPDGSLVIVSKGETGPVSVYRFPRELRAGSVMKLERVGKQIAGKASQAERITDAAISGDGKWIALRSRGGVTFYAADAFLRGEFRPAMSTDLARLGEAQGEGLAFGSGQTVYVAGEGGGKKAPGTLGTLTCKL